MIDRRTTFHTAALRESVTANSLIGQDRLSAYAANWFSHTGDLAYSNMRALGQLAQQIQIQAVVMTYSETFTCWASRCLPACRSRCC